MKDHILKIDRFVAEYNQCGIRSKLIPAVMSVMKCDQKQAEKDAHSHCNLLSTYALLYGPGYIEMSYEDWFRYLLDEKATDAGGWFKAEKPDIYHKLGHDISLVRYTSIDDLPDGLYQILIKNAKGGTHFMAGYVIDTILYVADTSFRGIKVPAHIALQDDTLVWVKQYVHN
jgi:hypothetical protein